MGHAPRICRLCARHLLALLATVMATGQAHKRPLKATELVVKRYERLIAHGSLLTLEGWKRASGVFDKLDPYPEHGEISIISTGGSIGEDWVKGNRAQVETKWDDYYGTIDSFLRFHLGPHCPTGMLESFSLVCVSPRGGEEKGAATDASCGGEWKIEGPLQARSATIEAATKYVAEMRDRSSDPAIRKNANSTITALRRLTGGCGTPNPC